MEKSVQKMLPDNKDNIMLNGPLMATDNTRPSVSQLCTH